MLFLIFMVLAREQTTVAIHAESRVTSVIIIIIKKGIMTGVFLLSFLLPLVALLVTYVIFFL